MQLTHNEVKDLYNNISSFSGTREQIAEIIKSKNLKVSVDEFSKSIPVLKKIASQSSVEEFGDFITKNEIPAVKLSNEEMSTLKGGVVPLIAYAAYGLMTAYYGYKLAKEVSR